MPRYKATIVYVYESKRRIEFSFVLPYAVSQAELNQTAIDAVPEDDNASDMYVETVVIVDAT